VDRAIVGAAREAERPIRPGPATGTALWRHLLRDTPDRREARHTALLGARAGEVRRALAQALDRCLSDAAACVVSSREKLESANRDDPQRPLAIQDALA
jgi:Zn-dependent M16 (insulinase) family peptidase